MVGALAIEEDRRAVSAKRVVNVHAAAVFAGRLRHEGRARAAVECDLLDDLLGAENVIGRADRVGRHEVELDLTGRGFIAPRLPRDTETVETAHDFVHEAGDVVGVVCGVAHGQRRADRREISIVRAARAVV